MGFQEGKSYDAIVTLRAKVSNIMNDFDIFDADDTFENLVRAMIEDEGICGMADDGLEIVNIEQIERKED
jgi:hypothetical protein